MALFFNPIKKRYPMLSSAACRHPAQKNRTHAVEKRCCSKRKAAPKSKRPGFGRRDFGAALQVKCAFLDCLSRAAVTALCTYIEPVEMKGLSDYLPHYHGVLAMKGFARTAARNRRYQLIRRPLDQQKAIAHRWQ